MFCLAFLGAQEEEKWRHQFDSAKAKEDAKRSDIPSLFKERDAIRKEVSDQCVAPHI